MTGKLARYAASIVICTVLVSSAVQAASFVYSGQRRQIKAGVLGTPNRAFYVLNERLDLKPAGWEFYNPAARAGRSKSDPDYWLVNISTASFKDIAEFDVLLVNSGVNLSPDIEIREKLRKFVDGGGTLWLEDGAALNGYFFLQNLGFGAGTTASVLAPLAAVAHPLLNRPFQIGWQEANNLGPGSQPVGTRCVTDGASGLPDVRYFITILQTGGTSPIVSAAQYGSGHIVAVSEKLSQAIVASETASGTQSEDLKLAYNIVNWGSEHTTFHKNPRHTGHTFTDAGANLATLWEFKADPPQLPTSSSPAILDDMVFYVDVGGILHAFDLSPSRDRDGDGKADDGRLDQSRGAPYDELWRFSLGEEASSPTAAYIPMGGGAAIPAVFVVTKSGKVRGFNAIAYTVNDPPSPNDVLDVGPFTTDIPAPTYVDGVLYAGDASGRLSAYDFIAGSSWQWPSAGNPGPALASPTVGYVRDPATGTVDQVVYLARRSDGGTDQEGVLVFPIKVFNEVLSTNLQGSGWVQVPIRSKGSTIKDGTWALRIYKGGELIRAVGPGIGAPDTSYAKLNGTRTAFELYVEPGTDNPNKSPTVIGDYEIDPGDGSSIQPRTTINIKAQTSTSAGVPSTPALGPRDILYFTTDNGSVYATQETGSKSARTIVKWRHYVGSGGTLAGSPAVSDGMLYVAVGSSLYAFEADPIFSINLGKPIDRRKPITVLQSDAMNPGNSPAAVGGVSSESVTDENVHTVPFVIDYDRGKITFHNFRTGDPSTDLDTSQPVTVKFTPAEEAGGSGMEEQQSHSISNLAWKAVLPSAAKSSPMVMGNILYIGCVGGELVAMDIDDIRGKTPRGGTADSKYVYSQNMSGGPILATVGGSSGVIALATQEGLRVLYNPVTLVADANRLVEIDSSGQVVWSCDGTTSYVVSADGSYGAVLTPFDRPAVARRAPMGGIVVADTGNNRVAHIDRGGNVIFEVSSFDDPNNILPPGSPLYLNKPMDVSMWMDMDGDYPVYHYLIADSGNYRVVEVVYKWNGSAYGWQLAWATKTILQGKQYRYVNARLRPDPNTGKLSVMSVISNYDARDPGMPGMEGPGGALARLEYDPSSSKNGLILMVMNTLEDRNGNPTKRLLSPSFFSREFRGMLDYSDVIIDSTGIYVADYDDSPDPRPYRIRTFTAQEYGKPFSPSYAQLLPSGNVLVTNKAIGGASLGEIFELSWNGTNYTVSWPAASIKLGSGSYGLRQPSSAERQAY